MTTARPKRVNRSRSVLVRLTPREHAKILAEAMAQGLGVSAWIRMIVLREFK